MNFWLYTNTHISKHLNDTGIVPQAVHKVCGMLVDVDFQKEPNQLHQLDLGLCGLLVAFETQFNTNTPELESDITPFGTLACLARVMKSSENR